MQLWAPVDFLATSQQQSSYHCGCLVRRILLWLALCMAVLDCWSVPSLKLCPFLLYCPVLRCVHLQVMVLIFLWPICNGLLEACERVEASAQQVLRPAGTHHSTSTFSKHHPHATTAVSWPSVLQAWQWLRSQGVSRKGVLHPTAPSRGATGSMKNPPGQKQGQGTMVRCMARVQSRVAACWRWVRRQGQWASPLFQLVLVKPALLAVHQAVTQDVHKALSSKQGEPVSQVLTGTAPSPVFWSIP